MHLNYLFDMKKLVGISVLAITAALISPIQSFAAAPKAGAACTKLGSTSIAANKKFTCVKSGKKMVWDKGTAVAKPTASTQETAPAPAATPSPKASAKPSAADLTIPITLPVAQTGAITFANAAANYAQIPQTAWQRVQDVIATNPENKFKTTIHIGPNTKASLNAINTALDRINKLFAGFRHVGEYWGIVYNAQDAKWAQTDAYDFFKSSNYNGFIVNKDAIKQQAEAGCEINGTTIVQCGGGMAVDLKDGGTDAGGAFYGVQSDGDYWSDGTKNVGPMTQVNHEAMHNYQNAQFFLTPLAKGQNISSDQMHAATPWWFSEGQANGIGISTFMENFTDYSRVRNDTVTRSPGSRASKPAFTEEGLKAFLNGTEIAGPQNNNWMLAYSIGYATVETLIAIGGPQSTLAIYTLAAKGEDWPTAFKHVYGISWDEASTVLAKVLAAEYAAKPMSAR
jgi:hypothetical protein